MKQNTASLELTRLEQLARNAMSFCLGYHNARDGKITRELTAREIASIWPYVDTGAFANGVQDGLLGDDYRHIRAHQIAQAAGLV